MLKIVFFDIEADKKPIEIGAVGENMGEFHASSKADFSSFIQGAQYLCGHNIFEHDLQFVKDAILQSPVRRFIDTLYWSPLLFPSHPYHAIGKQYKIVSESEHNNPVLDSKLARDLFFAEVSAFNKLDERLKATYFLLLNDKREFRDFFKFVGYATDTDCETSIREYFDGRICKNVNLSKYITDTPVELAYSLALINAENKYSVTPPWVLKHFPRVENLIYHLRSSRCVSGCKYCNQYIHPVKALQKFFSYPSFRTYEGEPLQEMAATAAIDGKSLLAIFPTGGGKSITFQLPALVQGEVVRGLTVIISPLQSLMKDQVDNLEQKGITDAVTINGALDPIDRAEAFRRVEDGSASLLYISPESLRSKSLETLLLKRNIVRFVIDEAHCFSSWGQDFRIDYLYIGDFIKGYQEKKNLSESIPVSCFTATAKQKVVEDILAYFREKLNLELEIFRSGAQRTNLKYFVFHKSSPEDKYQQLRTILETNDCPAIIYVSRTKRTKELAARLTKDGVVGGVVAYHGQMDKQERVENQEKFMKGDVRIIVATTAFGMGVDKSDVKIVIHYDISTSLEDYVQEAGRAGRDEKINAECFILFDEEDLNKHFILLNQNKLSIKEIQQVWKAIKEITKLRSSASKSALEIAREAGWDDSINDIETRVRTAIAALEESGFMKRGQNNPQVLANSILVGNMDEAVKRINSSHLFAGDKERQDALRIIKSLISAKQRSKAGNEDGESRIDYLSDSLGIVKENVVRIINIMREERILADAKDLIAFIKKNGRINTSLNLLNEFSKIEQIVIGKFDGFEQKLNLKELNRECEEVAPQITIQKLKTILNFYVIKNWIRRAQSDTKDVLIVKSNFDSNQLLDMQKRRAELARFVITHLFEKSMRMALSSDREEVDVEFSCLEIKEKFENGDLLGNKTSFVEIDDTLYYLTKIGALRLDGAFLVAYNAMRIERTEQNTRRQYKKDDYKRLEDFYNNKVQQIHIVGEYAKRMANDYRDALRFVDDYFKLNYDSFLRKYFKGREAEITKNITPKKFKQLFGDLSPRQLSIIKNDDPERKHIVVAAGPGSGKTKVLVHKLASLYIMEDVKHEQMLMLTFSRAAATEFRRRLSSPEMLGNAANFIGGGTRAEGITTFHSYCFDLLGRVGSLTDSDTVITEAVRRIRSGEIEANKITKTVLVIDEAQDMSEIEFSLVEALMEANEEMRVIAVGDDDQNIYEFRKSDSKYLRTLIDDHRATKYELVDNYRSLKNIVGLANEFVRKLSSRLKTTDVRAVKQVDGEVCITKYISPNLALPVVNDILSRSLSGTVCVLTETNDEAATIAGHLIKKGISARLIQDSAGFSMYNLAETRFFIDALKLRDDIYIIDNDIWQAAKQRMEQEYSGSVAFDYAVNFIKTFEDGNPKGKYKTDFLQLAHESKLEDFAPAGSSQIIVSTIHKAKGREFDNVFLTLKQYRPTDAKKRDVYVAITRAKNNLYIHCSSNCFDGIRVNGVVKRLDEAIYEEPVELIIPVSYKGVNLGAFYYFKSADIANVKSRDELQIKQELLEYQDGRKISRWFCYTKDGKKVVLFSDAMCKKIDAIIAKGYIPQAAIVRLIVWWQKTDEKGKEYPEIKAILPDIQFIREDRKVDVE